MKLSTIVMVPIIAVVIILGGYFILRLFDQSQMIDQFPLDKVNDYSSRMATLYFLDVCGFYQECPYWYNGFVLFEGYPPGTYFAMYPLYLLIKNVQATTFMFVILLFITDVYLLYLLMKSKGKGKLESVLFFVLLFANAVSIGNFIRLGRITEHFAWTIFIFLMYLVYRYKEKKFDKFFYSMFILAYGGILISHYTIAILVHIPLLSLLLVKPWRERAYLSLAVLMGILLSSFWTIPYILSVNERSTLMFVFTRSLLNFREELMQNVMGIGVALVFLVLMIVLGKRERLFYLPLIGLVVLYLTRLVVIIPLFKNIFPDSYLFLMLFFAIYLLVTADTKKEKMVYPIVIGLVIISIASVTLSHIHTPYFVNHTALEEDMLYMLSEVDGPFMMFFSRDTPDTSYGNAYYSYAPVYLNLTTPSGWSRQTVNKEYLQDLSSFQDAIMGRDCKSFVSYAKKFNATNVIGHKDICDNYKYCNLKLVSMKNEVCLYRTEAGT